MSWNRMSIADLGEVFDGPHATPTPADAGPVFLGIKNISPDGHLDLSEVRHVSQEEYPRWTRRVVPSAGDLVFTYEATLHRYALIPEGFVGCLGRRVALVRPDPAVVTPEFLLYRFQSPSWRAKMEQNVLPGATVDRIPLSRFPSFEIQVPPVPIQRRIADTLSAYDDLIENNNRRMELLEEAIQILYREWFVYLRFPGHERVKVVDGVPEGWRRAAASDLVDVLSGGTPKTSIDRYWGGGIPFFTPKDAGAGFFATGTEKTLTDEGLGACNSPLFPEGTLFVTARGTVGKLRLAARAMAMNQSCYALRPRNPYTSVFAFCTMTNVVSHLRMSATGGVFDTIIKATFDRTPVILPHHDLVAEFSKVGDPIMAQIAGLTAMNLRLREARDLLLPRLMDGRIAV